MILNEDEFPEHNMAKLIKGAVVPRAIAWVSSIDKDGMPNLAPFSFFTVASMDPITLCFSAGPGNNESGFKDTVANIKETGEFVVNIVSEDMANKMYESSKNYDPEEDEFARADIASAPSELVRAPRVSDSPVNMECTLDRIVEVGASRLILGRVICYHLKDEIEMDSDKVDPHKLKPVGRMAGDYTYVRDFYKLPNPDLKD
ncbi:flavin reductase family protein [Thalassobacillus sp. CUG 92003]|uniref:flavin reductase family protein n=1 Tax=Thalassobacillus sp. CUG 92003 TaxID=2736641 RepID=UPI0015E7BAA1|nr:flavin reductase family protein [Thalassobacillus sp. CUG 92003]